MLDLSQRSNHRPKEGEDKEEEKEMEKEKEEEVGGFW